MNKNEPIIQFSLEGNKHSDYLSKSKKYKSYHYSVLKEDMIKYLHNKTLEMTKEVINIFNKNNIRYMICGGTLLGAITTGEFIPWDDDVDICVLEDDYDKMYNILLTELPNWMALQCTDTEPKYYHGWLKIRDKESTVSPFEPKYKYNGVWIDLYKLTKTKMKEVPYLICKEHIDYLHRRYNNGCITHKELNQRLIENNLVEKLTIEEQLMNSSTDNKETYIIWSASKILIEPEWCFPRKTYIFENLKLHSFNNPEAYLKRHYGENYMTLPPNELRQVGIYKIEYKK